MSLGTTIGWTNATWNPTVGCTRVSAGCDNCYAFRMTRRLDGMGQKDYEGLVNPGKNHFNGKVRILKKRLRDPLKWRKPKMVFVDSMSDLFHHEVPFWFIDKVFAGMAITPEHTYQILTKRPERALEWFQYKDKDWAHGAHEGMQGDQRIRYQTYHEFGKREILPEDWHWPLRNVWMGVSAEDQQTANQRIPQLIQCPAIVHFASLEPLLGPINLSRWVNVGNSSLSWVICGGESGPGARPVNGEWIRDLRAQCMSCGVPFFFKQWGEYTESGQKVGKHKAGNLIDGIRYEYFPHAQPV